MSGTAAARAPTRRGRLPKFPECDHRHLRIETPRAQALWNSPCVRADRCGSGQSSTVLSSGTRKQTSESRDYLLTHLPRGVIFSCVTTFSAPNFTFQFGD